MFGVHASDCVCIENEFGKYFALTDSLRLEFYENQRAFGEIF